MFDRTQTALKVILPSKWYLKLYNISWEMYLQWVGFYDRCHFMSSKLLSQIIGNKEKSAKYRILGQILPYTMVGKAGILVTYNATKHVEKEKIEGALVECGVARGGSSGLMALVSQEYGSNRTSWLFDTFEGLPPPTDDDNYVSPTYSPKNKRASVVIEGFCLGTIEEVSETLFKKLGVKKDNTKMVKGLFQDTLPIWRDKIGAIAVLRLDGDWYESTKCCLENLYSNVAPKGIVILDDYVSVPGCKKATDEFLKENDIDVELIFDNRGGCYFIKP